MVKCIKGKDTYFSIQLITGKFYEYEIISHDYSLITDYEKYFGFTSDIVGARNNSSLAKEIYQRRQKYIIKVSLPTLVVIGDDNSKHYFCNLTHKELIEEYNIIVGKDGVINENNGHQSRLFTTSIYMTETYFETMDVLRNRILENLGI